ncbi:MAG: hypothetical protein GEV05_29590 [Betaproteobacteria bacterium]|nr:hypothetical protein [Betaproteobacteria bacterium]
MQMTFMDDVAISMPNTSEEHVSHYLRTGHCDINAYVCWPGNDVIDCMRRAKAALRSALVDAVRERVAHARSFRTLPEVDVTRLTIEKVAPMVQGLFPLDEQPIVLDMLGRCVVFLTSANIESVLTETVWCSTAWTLSNLYLESIVAPLLGPDAPRLVGLSQATTCYVSKRYFEAEGAFDDFVVHEAAHIFHNCKRVTIGLPEVRRREWLLDIDFRKRETFAYCCEAFSRIVASAANRSTRHALVAHIADSAMPPDEDVDPDEYLDILREACSARNGWKRIRERCAPPMRRGNRRTGN